MGFVPIPYVSIHLGLVLIEMEIAKKVKFLKLLKVFMPTNEQDRNISMLLSRWISAPENICQNILELPFFDVCSEIFSRRI